MVLEAASAALLRAARADGRPPIHESTPAEVRAVSDPSVFGPGPAMHEVIDTIATADGGVGVPVRLLIPTASPRATILYFHGGGWVLGDVESFDTLGRKLAAAAGATVVMVDYRLAPEHPFPAALDDAWTALQWTVAQAGRKDGIVGPLVVAGDSAGGNLALGVARRARADGPDLAAALLVYPVTDVDTTRASYVHPDNQLLISKATMLWFLAHYLQGMDGTQPDISPLNDVDLSGLPPTAVALAEHDPLLDEGRELVLRLRDSGVPVADRLFEGQMHGFFQLTNVLAASDTAVGWLVEFLDSRLTRTSQDS
ncbi:MAG: alpha/beta hydrolase [Actinomycetota bacterium]|nr:alpha/beta hydrolase [Actinomycetota bacterium]